MPLDLPQLGHGERSEFDLFARSKLVPYDVSFGNQRIADSHSSNSTKARVLKTDDNITSTLFLVVGIIFLLALLLLLARRQQNVGATQSSSFFDSDYG